MLTQAERWTATSSSVFLQCGPRWRKKSSSDWINGKQERNSRISRKKERKNERKKERKKERKWTRNNK